MCLQQKFFRNVFSALVLVSPSLGVDDMLNPLLKRMSQLGQDPDRDSRKEFDDAWLQEKLDNHKKVIQYQKARGVTKLHSLLVILDDVCDQGPALRAAGSGTGALSTIFTRGRHLGIACVLSLQKVTTACPPLLRTNVSDWLIGRQRVLKGLIFLLGEVSALLPSHRALDWFYRKATEKPYSFLWVSPARQPDDVFHLGFTKGVPIKKILRKFKKENQSGEDVEILADDPGSEGED